jgi:hypothetical protein
MFRKTEDIPLFRSDMPFGKRITTNPSQHLRLVPALNTSARKRT